MSEPPGCQQQTLVVFGSSRDLPSPGRATRNAAQVGRVASGSLGHAGGCAGLCLHVGQGAALLSARGGCAGRRRDSPVVVAPPLLPTDHFVPCLPPRRTLCWSARGGCCSPPARARTSLAACGCSSTAARRRAWCRSERGAACGGEEDAWRGTYVCPRGALRQTANQLPAHGQTSCCCLRRMLAALSAKAGALAACWCFDFCFR